MLISFKEFMFTEGNKFPYNNLKVTRNGIHPRWLLTEGSYSSGSLLRTRNFFLIPSSSLPKKTVQRLILDKAVLPLPDDFCDVVDCMETWGRSLSYRWEQEVLKLMAD